MGTAGEDAGRELETVERARSGARDAFVALYRQDAAPAWRLAHALAGDRDRAEAAVAEGFRRALAPLRAPLPRTEVAFRVRLLAAVRHAVLDGSGPEGRPDAPPPPDGDRPAEVQHAFAALPESWQTVLWLVVVEGLGTLDAARVLDLAPDEAEALHHRARAGLRAQWRREREVSGHAASRAPAHLERELQPQLPLPLELFEVVEQRWRETRRRDDGPLHLVLPGGRAVPTWAERALVGTTAALIALGISTALTVDRDTTGRQRPGPTALGPGEQAAGAVPGPGRTDADPAARSGGAPGGDAPATGDGPASGAGPTVDPTTTPAAAAVGAAGGVTATAATVAMGDDEGGEDPPPPAPAPLLEVTAGVGALGLRVGDRCAGVELGPTVVGCAPHTADEGLTLDVDSRLLPGL